MGRRTWLVAVAALVAGLGGCGGSESSARTPASSTLAGQPPAKPAETTLKGRDVVTGRAVDLASFRGKPTVVAIWAAWCPPCQEDGPVFARFAREHPDVGFVGVDTQDGAAAARAFIRTYRWRFPSVADPSGRLAERLRMRTMPTTIVLDADHHEVGRLIGATTLPELERLVERAGA
jgi:thiol-disulfide isomerase/thioredoxin